MRIVVHDYSGHPFQVQLSRALAARGHEVLHLHCSSYETGKGAVDRLPADPPNLEIRAIGLARKFDRYSWARRIRQESEYGAAVTAQAAAFRPDVILSSNDPLFAKAKAARWCRSRGVPWVFWLQDLYSMAMSNYARSRLGSLGTPVGASFGALEGRLLRQAAAVVAITDDFLPILRRWGVPEEQIHVIPNWAPLEELPPKAKANPWSREHGLDGCRVLLYAGTLGLKHNPNLLVALAARFRSEPDVRLVVISEGKGAEWLREQIAAHHLDNLVLLNFQPYERLPEVFASADVLLALLERDAGVFSVPSKVLSYLCAGRAVLAAIPPENLAAQTIARANAGTVVSPDDEAGFVTAAARLLNDAPLRQSHARHGRAYAEMSFDVDKIATRFDEILTTAAFPQRV